MLNHIPTLLLNERSDDVTAWPVDSSYSPLLLDGLTGEVHDLLISPELSFHEKESRVLQLLPFVVAPDFAGLLAGVDRRMTFTVAEPHSVAGFYALSSRGGIDGVSESLTSESVVRFLTTCSDWENDISQTLDCVWHLFAQSSETTRRLSAVVVAYILKADALWRKVRV